MVAISTVTNVSPTVSAIVTKKPKLKYKQATRERNNEVVIEYSGKHCRRLFLFRRLFLTTDQCDQRKLSD